MAKDFMGGYKRYDTSRGFGGPRRWRQAFQGAMGFEEAEEVINEAKAHGNTPLGILGLSGKPAWNEIKRAYRKMATTYHPDVYRGEPDALMKQLKAADPTEMMKKINAAFVVLERQYGK
jgi:DnaJ-class molecular chaperone